MSEETPQYIRNVPGRYWVEQDICLAHQCCNYEAPNNFCVEEANAWVARVYKQPETLEEERQCQEALNCCPVAAIHNDGEANLEARKYVAA